MPSLTIGELGPWFPQLIKEGVRHGENSCRPLLRGVLQKLGHLQVVRV